MIRKTLIAVFLVVLSLTLHAQTIGGVPLSARITGYNITASLNTENHTINAEMDAWWVNPSSKPVPDMMLHMYLNAFSSNKTCFAENDNWSALSDDGWGWVRIISMTDNAGNDLVSSMNFVRPDKKNENDSTVLNIELPVPVMPKDTLKLHIVFESRLPSPITRTGFSEDFYFVAQWFPKFGVYETAGMRQRKADGWNCHQFHANSEFYANHSVYNVSVTIPDNYVAGSGGLLVGEKFNRDGTKEISWRAEDIVDFAWTACPDYVEVKDRWRDVDITLLTTEQALKNADSQVNALKNALEYFDTVIGKYPWSYVTFVDPPMAGAGASGMEYTTLFTSSPSIANVKFFKYPEMTTIHEFGHAYFMGILASNESEEPWLDEGLNSYWEQRIVDHYYGNGYGLINLPFLRMSDSDMQRSEYVSSESKSVATNDLPSWSYPHGTYGMMSYNKATVWLRTLEGIIGTPTMDKAFREYYDRWAFRYPSGRDFIAVVNDVVRADHGNKFGEDMNWYFDQVLYGSSVCDYSIKSVVNKRQRSDKFSPSGGTDSDKENIETGMTSYRSTLKIERNGEITIPVKILVRFSNGEEITENWDGKERYKDFTYERPARMIWAKIDPDNMMDMDVNRINNSYGEKPNRKSSGRMMTKYLTLFQFLMALFTV